MSHGENQSVEYTVFLVIDLLDVNFLSAGA